VILKVHLGTKKTQGKTEVPSHEQNKSPFIQWAESGHAFFLRQIAHKKDAYINFSFHI
jgi:hypothetical protein